MDSLSKEKLQFINNILIPSGIKDKKLLDTFKNIPREKFIARKFVTQAYTDRPLPIGSGQTISQPSLVALMTQLLDLKGKEKVLEIGTGSGYQTAILAALAKKVYSIERINKIALKAQKTLKKFNLNNIYVINADGSKGLEKYQPYDAIIVTAGAKNIPNPLLEQLKVGGRLVIPTGENFAHQKLKLIIKKQKGYFVKEITPVAFVPLIGKYGWNQN